MSMLRLHVTESSCGCQGIVQKAEVGFFLLAYKAYCCYHWWWMWLRWFHTVPEDSSRRHMPLKVRILWAFAEPLLLYFTNNQKPSLFMDVSILAIHIVSYNVFDFSNFLLSKLILNYWVYIKLLNSYRRKNNWLKDKQSIFSHKMSKNYVK